MMVSFAVRGVCGVLQVVLVLLGMQVVRPPARKGLVSAEILLNRVETWRRARAS
jgi:hypothetical protein